jgi:hypothetical protein
MELLRRAGALLRDAVLLEVAVWRGLARWVARRPDVPRGQVPVGYARLVTPVLLLWVFASAVEVVVVDLVLPWASLRVPLLVVGLWGVLWMLGMLGAYRTRPHLLADELLVVRGGLRLAVPVPLAAVEQAIAREEDMPGSIRSLAVVDDLLQVGVSGRTNLQLRLTGPTTLGTPKGPVTVTRVGAWVDEPREVAAVLRRRLSAPLP